jgi:hypothetical protein
MMQSNNDTILSMIRVAQSLDDAGLYHQSDRVYQSLIKIAQVVVDKKSIPQDFEDYWAEGTGNLWEQFLRMFRVDPDGTYRSTRYDNRTGVIDKVISNYANTGEVPKQFVDLFIKSPTFRKDLMSYLNLNREVDMTEIGVSPLTSSYVDPLGFAKTLLDNSQQHLARLNKRLNKNISYLEKRDNPLIRRSVAEDEEAIRKQQLEIDKIKEFMQKTSARADVRKKSLQTMLTEFGSSILSELNKLSKEPKNKEKYESLVSALKELQDEGVRIDSAFTSYIEEVFPKQPESGAYLKQRELAELELIPTGLLTDEQFERLIELRKRNRESVGTGPNVEVPASAELAALEKSMGLTDENAAASQYPKAPTETPQSTQQVKGPDLFSRTTKAPGSKPNNIQRVRFKSPVPSSSAITIEELFKLVQNKPDRWEQFNNISKDPKLNLDAIKKLLKELSGKMGKGSIALSQAVKGLNLNSPYWQLAEPALEIVLNEFGKYIENPSAYSIENKYDYVNKKIDDILSDKSISNKYKYFIDNYSSYKKLMDSVDWNRLIAKLNSSITRSNLFNLNIK